MNTWHFYDVSTGIFTGATFSGAKSEIQAQLDHKGAGLDAYLGDVDYLSQKMINGVVVDYQPPAPTNDELQTWLWDAGTKRWVSTPTATSILSAAKETYEAAAQGALDSLAQSWGYDNIVSACSYALSTNEKFKAESLALIAWRDALWTEAYAIEVAVSAGTQELPATSSAFLSLLPNSPTRPE